MKNRKIVGMTFPAVGQRVGMTAVDETRPVHIYRPSLPVIRPFRVNAGPVHSYALLADGRTKYLSELCAGDQARISNNIRFVPVVMALVRATAPVAV